MAPVLRLLESRLRRGRRRPRPRRDPRALRRAPPASARAPRQERLLVLLGVRTERDRPRDGPRPAPGRVREADPPAVDALLHASLDRRPHERASSPTSSRSSRPSGSRLADFVQGVLTIVLVLVYVFSLNPRLAVVVLRRRAPARSADRRERPQAPARRRSRRASGSARWARFSPRRCAATASSRRTAWRTSRRSASRRANRPVLSRQPPVGPPAGPQLAADGDPRGDRAVARLRVRGRPDPGRAHDGRGSCSRFWPRS